MALTHLVDTSVLTRLRYQSVRDVIERIAAVTGQPVECVVPAGTVD